GGRRRLADAESLNRRTDQLHRVVDRKPRRHHAARRVDVHVDFLLGVLRLKKEKLRRDQAGADVFNAAGDEDHALLEQARKDVVLPLAPCGLLQHVGHERVHVQIAENRGFGRGGEPPRQALSAFSLSIASSGSMNSVSRSTLRSAISASSAIKSTTLSSKIGARISAAACGFWA